MCGIAGWYRRDGRSVGAAIITAQCNTMLHRGPDDAGYFIDGDFGFGMRRLSIIDVAGGHQPIESLDGRYAIVFNGEIYNHLELRAHLESEGVCFRTHSDTETLLASYIRWQDDVWHKLEGMYAVAIWDRQSRTLMLARDPLGVKPLYFTRQRAGIAFASELRALKVVPEQSFTIDEHAVNDFFSFGHVQKPRSIYKEVRSLDPGHVLRIRGNGEPSVREFWRPRFHIREGLSENEWIEDTRARVFDTVKKHMLSDVPIGSFLSGGIDSATVTAVMSRVSDSPVKAFTLGLPGSKLDETESARAVARHLGCEHIVLPLEPMKAAELLPAVQGAFDEPCAATAVVPIWHISRLAAQHVKVVLCGEGGDELFAGYKRQRTARHMQTWRPLVRVLGPAMGIIDRLPATRSRRWNYLRQNAMRFRDAALLDSGYQRFFKGTQITSPSLRESIYEESFRRRQSEEDEYKRLEADYFGDSELRALQPLQQFLLADLTVHMPGSLLNRLDRASMAHSLESRVPFLTHKFVDWTMTMPLDLKLRGHVGKYVLRQAARPWLEEGVLRAPKLGFQLPFSEWFTGDFSDFARDAWQNSGVRASGFLNSNAVETLFDEHRAGQANHGRALFAITMFSCWWQGQAVAPADGVRSGASGT